MAWTAPRTWVTGEVVTASIMNTHVRDNFNETGPAKATGSGGFIVTNGVNSIIQRTPGSALVATLETTTSTSYTNLATSGATVNVTHTTAALVCHSCEIWNDTAGAFSFVGVNLTGGTTLAPTDSLAIAYESSGSGDRAKFGMAQIYTGLTLGGSTNFQMQYRVSGGTGSFQARRISVIPF